MQQPAPEADVALPVVWRLERARLSGQPLPAVPGALWPSALPTAGHDDAERRLAAGGGAAGRRG